METKERLDGKTLHITGTGKFVFQDHGRMQHVLNFIANHKIQTVEFDFKDVVFIDSAAIGMLLIINEKAKLTVTNVSGQVKRVLDVVNAQKLFTIITEV